jgi:hypothetical protein
VIDDAIQALGSPQKLASWAGLCPGTLEPAGKPEAGHAANGPLDVKRKALLVRRGRELSIFALPQNLLGSVFVMIDQGGHYRDARVDYETVGVEPNAPRWMKMRRTYEHVPA